MIDTSTYTASPNQEDMVVCESTPESVAIIERFRLHARKLLERQDSQVEAARNDPSITDEIFGRMIKIHYSECRACGEAQKAALKRLYLKGNNSIGGEEE
jgi:hypothetical protein